MIRYKVTEIDELRFYLMPKELFQNPLYKKLNSDAKILYSILRDRMELSRKNNWINANGEIYLIFSRDTMSQLMGVSLPTIQKAFEQLRKIGLIEEEKRGQVKPNIIFIGKMELQCIEDCTNREEPPEYVDMAEKENILISEYNDILYHDKKIFVANDTKVIDTDLSNNNSNSNKSQQKDVVVDVHKLVSEFRKKYKAELDPTRTQTLIKQKGINHVQDCIATYGDYLQGRTVRSIGADFYTFVSQGYTKPVAQIAKSLQFNFEQRDYDDMEQFYTNVMD